MWEANFTVKGSTRFHTPPDETAAHGHPVGFPTLALAPRLQFRPGGQGLNGSGVSQVGTNEAGG